MSSTFFHIFNETGAHSVLALLRSVPNIRLYLDTETSGFDANDPDGIKLLQLGYEPEGKDKPVIFVIAGATLYGKLRQQWIDIFHSAKQVAIHNAKFDLKFLAGLGCDVSKIRTFDTMLAIKILYNGLLKFGGAGLADITTGVFNVALDKRYGKLDWSKPDLEPDMLEYAASDIQSLFMVHKAFMAFGFNTFPPLLKLYYLKFLWFEHICLPSVTQLEINGIYVDKEAIAATKAELEPTVKALEQDIVKTLEATDPSFKNPRSAIQMVKALNLAGLESITTTSKDVLPDYLDDHEVIGKILEWKKSAKLVEFLDSMQDSISPHTGRIHGSFNQVGTDTGRFSASSPNLQQLPRDVRIRRIFKPQKEGWQLVVADYSQLELVICAEITQDPEMLRAYREHIDLHKLTASFCTNKDLALITKADRQLAKAVNFGLIYGMGAKKFRIYSKIGYGVDITLEQAYDTRDIFMTKYVGVPQWHERANKEQRACQIMPSFTLAKRYRLSRHPAQTAGFRFSSYVNSQDQGTGGDIAKLAVYLLQKYIDYNQLNHLVMIISIVHDEVILEAHDSIAELMCEKLSQAMIIAGKVWVKSIPVEAEAGKGLNWADAKP